jgi:hypothetical protein
MELVRHSPLALPFEKAIQPSEFLLQIRKSAESDLLAEVAEQGGETLGLAMAGACLIKERCRWSLRTVFRPVQS